MSSRETLNKESDLKFLNNDSIINQELISSEKQFHLQKNLDEKIANNMLKLNIVLFSFTIILSVIFVFYSSTIIYKVPEEIQLSEYSSLSFSLIDFTIGEKNNTRISNNYLCVKDAVTCENDCKSIDFNYIKTKFKIDCFYFSKFYLAGLIFIIGISLGTLLNVFSITAIILLIFNKITLNTMEIIIAVERFESIIYLLFFLEYILHTGLLFTPALQVGISFFIMILIILLSVTNYMCFRTSFYNKLRISSRI